MTPWSRALLRLQQGLLRCYEFFLISLLLAMALLAAWPASSAQQEGADPYQCGGKNQSSPVVMNR